MLTESDFKKGKGEREGMRGDPTLGRKHSESVAPSVLGRSQALPSSHTLTLGCSPSPSRGVLLPPSGRCSSSSSLTPSILCILSDSHY